MLPSFRLIGATFLCSFFVVFVGLRMAASLNDIHEGLPVMAAHAAPMTVAPAADRDARRGASSVPVMYDLRFAVAPVSPILVRSAPTLIERPVPQLPLAILPPDLPSQEATEPAAQPAAQPEATVAAIDRDADVAPAPSAIPELPSTIVAEPLPPLEPAAETPAQNSAQDAKAAATEPQNASAPDATPAEPLLAEPETSVDVPIPAQDTVAAKPAEPAAKPEPEHAKAAHAKPKAVARPKPAHKPRIRTARRATSLNNSFDIGNPASSPFGGPTRTQ